MPELTAHMIGCPELFLQLVSDVALLMFAVDRGHQQRHGDADPGPRLHQPLPQPAHDLPAAPHLCSASSGCGSVRGCHRSALTLIRASCFSCCKSSNLHSQVQQTPSASKCQAHFAMLSSALAWRTFVTQVCLTWHTRLQLTTYLHYIAAMPSKSHRQLSDMMHNFACLCYAASVMSAATQIFSRKQFTSKQ